MLINYEKWPNFQQFSWLKKDKDTYHIRRRFPSISRLYWRGRMVPLFTSPSRRWFWRTQGPTIGLFVKFVVVLTPTITADRIESIIGGRRIPRSPEIRKLREETRNPHLLPVQRQGVKCEWTLLAQRYPRGLKPPLATTTLTKWWLNKSNWGEFND